MKTFIQHRVAHVIAISGLAMGLAACGPNDGQTAGQKLDQTIERTEQAAENARIDAERAAAQATVKIDGAVEATQDAAANATAATQEAASDALAVAGEAGITARVKSSLIAEPEISAMRIDVDTHGSVVTLTGEVATQAAKDRAATLAQAVSGVTSVNNNLVVK